MRDTWQTVRQAIRVGKLNKTLTIPAFSVPSGELKTGIHFMTDNVDQGRAQQTGFVSSITAALSIEALIKLDRLPFDPVDDAYAVIFERTSFVTRFAWLAVNANGTLELSLRKGGIDTIFQSDIVNAVPVGEWVFICASWDGTTVNLYVNETLVGSTAFTGPINDLPTHNFIGKGNHASGGETHNQFSGIIAEVRVWDIGRTLDDIIFSKHSPQNLDNPNLKFYYKFQEGSGNASIESVNGGVATLLNSGVLNFEWITDESQPLKYGASKIVRRFTVTGTRRVSLMKFQKPENVNHCLCVGWTDLQGKWQRRKLYSATPDDDYGIETIWPNPETYIGEPLAETFYLEVWNVDGRPTADLEEDLTILVSLTNSPPSVRDQTRSSYVTPVGTSVLYDTSPITDLMLVPDTQKMFGQ